MEKIDLGTRFLKCHRDGHLVWCIIDRPESRNALSPSMYYGFKKAVEVVNSIQEPVALIITGVDDVFAPGGEMRGVEEDRNPALDHIVRADVVPFEAIRLSRAPVVSAVNGICQGGGLLIAMLSDVAVVSERATFRAPELLRGIADMGYASYLPPHIGLANAKDLLLSARRIDASEALAMGLVSRCVPHEELKAAAIEAANQLLMAAPEARMHVKRALNAGYGYVDRMTFEASVMGPEAREGMRAFAEKRAPSWIPPELSTKSRL